MKKLGAPTSKNIIKSWNQYSIKEFVDIRKKLSNGCKLTDFNLEIFLHGTIEKFFYDYNKKIFQIVFSYLKLKKGGCLFECNITITDWWDLEVIEKGSKVNHKYSLDAIPTDIKQIFEYTFSDQILTLEACGY